MLDLENQEWWVKESFYPRGNSPHPSSCSQKVDMSYEWENLQLNRFYLLSIIPLFLHLNSLLFISYIT